MGGPTYHTHHIILEHDGASVAFDSNASVRAHIHSFELHDSVHGIQGEVMLSLCLDTIRFLWLNLVLCRFYSFSGSARRKTLDSGPTALHQNLNLPFSL
jgi:hypothetical protein